jgi:hypothetical protein
MGEKSSQPTKHANKIIITIFLTAKAMILDTHGREIRGVLMSQKLHLRKMMIKLTQSRERPFSGRFSGIKNVEIKAGNAESEKEEPRANSMQEI